MTARPLRAGVAALLLGAVLVAWGGEHAARSAAHERLLQQGEGQLAAGDAAAALDTLERAAAMGHDPDTEMALVRALMAQGEYRRAQAFAAHVAGGHLEAPEAAALYGWLLCVGGQCPYGRALVEQALGRAANHPVLAAAAATLREPGALPGGILLQRPQRVAPPDIAAQAAHPESWRVAGSGVLMDDGLHALLPLEALQGRAFAAVRDGLGRLRTVTLVRAIAPLGLALVRLDVRLDAGFLARGPREGFAGSPSYAVAFTPSSDGAAAWPWLYAGFLGRAGAAGTAPRLGIELPSRVAQAVVYDAAGRMLGLALRDDQGTPRLLSARHLRDALGEATGDATGEVLLPSHEAAARLNVDDIYQRAMRTTLQVLVGP
ncbi:MAG TPA: hypothetical protein VJ693_05965 [Ideonella sp.]|nr:hypothetical protein [Ideonella sp.]